MAHLRPTLCVQSVQGSPAAAAQLLVERGFVVCGIFAEDAASTKLSKADVAVEGDAPFRVTLALSKRLIVSQAVDAGLEVKDAERYTSDELVRLAQAAITIIQRAPITFEGVTLLHDYTLLSEITASMDVHKMNAYFGSEIALYFAWVRYYTKYLWIAAAVGLPLFLLQLWTGEVDSPFAGFFSIFIAFWGTCFLEFWKRENSTLAFTWGVHDIEQDEQEREIVKRTASKAGSEQRWKFAATIPLVLFSIGLVLRVMLYFIWLQDNAEAIYGDSWLQYWPTVIYSIAPIVFAFAFDKLAITLTKFEGHSTKSEYANSLVMKQVAFQFVNCYSALFYIAFWLKDIERLRGMLMSLLLMKQLLNNAIEMSVPYQSKAFEFVKAKIGMTKSSTPSEASTASESTPTSASSTSSNDSFAEELARPQYDLESDYLELVLQYGYITMFAVAFPLAPALALLNNLYESKVDMFKLSKSKRPPIVNRSTIGAWYYALEALSFISVLTNCALLALVSEHMHNIVPTELHEMLDTQYGKLSIMIALEHVILGVKYILSHVINDIPGWLRQNLAIENQKRKEQLQQERRMLFDSTTPVETTDAKKEISERQVAINKLQSQYATGFFFSPMVLLVLVFTPYLIIYLGISAWYAIPLGIMFVTYLQANKERADRQAACGIVADSRVLRLIMEELPGWVYDSEVERAEWLNKIIDRLWNDLSGAVKDIIMTEVQPILDANRPAFVTSLGFREVDLGRIAPKIVGVRVLSTDEHLIRMDLEFKWAGTAEIVLEVGRKEMPLLIELSNLQFTGKVRIELAPLIPRIPLFGALTVTFLKPPHVDFNFKVASMNLMNLGAADYNLANLVGATIRSAIKGMMLYPKKLVIPMKKDIDLHDLTHATPTGVLNLQVVSAANLIVADLTSSDPYAVIKFMDEEFRTPVIWKTLNPVWDFSCDVMVYDAHAQLVELTVYDKDIGSKDDFMGRAELQLGLLVPGVMTELDLPLTGVKSGSVKVRATYSRLSSGVESKGSEDILFNASSNADESQVHAADETTTTSAPAVNRSSSKMKLGLPSNGVLVVSGVRCRELTRRSGILAGTLKAYARLSSEQNTHSTNVRKGDSDPIFEGSYNFLLRDAPHAVLTVEIMDKCNLKSDEVLGTVSIPVRDVLANNGKIEREFPLESRSATGYVALRLAFNRAG